MNPLQCDRGVASRQSFYLQTNFVLNIPYYQSINYQRKKKRALPSFSQKKKKKKERKKERRVSSAELAVYAQMILLVLNHAISFRVDIGLGPRHVDR